MDDSVVGLMVAISLGVAVLLAFLYWDRIKAWNGHREEMQKQRRNREGRA